MLWQEKWVTYLAGAHSLPTFGLKIFLLDLCSKSILYLKTKLHRKAVLTFFCSFQCHYENLKYSSACFNYLNESTVQQEL